MEKIFLSHKESFPEFFREVRDDFGGPGGILLATLAVVFLGMVKFFGNFRGAFKEPRGASRRW